MISRRTNIPLFVCFTLIILLVSSENHFAQNNLSITTSFQMIGGSYSDSVSHNRSYYLYGGIRYQAQDYYLSLVIPLVATGNQTFTQVGGMYIPNKDNNAELSNQLHSSATHNSMMNGGATSMSAYNYGIGDAYLYSSYVIYNNNDGTTKITFDGYIKFPTATSSLNIGTGKFDYNLGVGIKKAINNFLILGQFGYLMLGKESESNIENPFTLSIGLGKIFDSGKQSILVSYDSYSTIISGISSPKQISVGYNFVVTPSITYLVTGSLGLNNSTSAYSLSGGINFNI